GNVKHDGRAYWAQLKKRIDASTAAGQILQHVEYIPDEKTEVYFKAADLVALPYTHVFQSGVLFLAYNFGVPVVASAVGSIREDVVDGMTGFVARPMDSDDLAGQIAKYFESPLYQDQTATRSAIKKFANDRYSWSTVGTITREVYTQL